MLGNFHLTVWLFLSTFSSWTSCRKSRSYSASPTYIVLRPLAKKTTLYFHILDSYSATNFVLRHNWHLYLLVFRTSWSSIRNLLLKIKNISEKNYHFQMNLNDFGYIVDYLGQNQLLLTGLFFPVSSNIVKSILNYHFVLGYMPEYHKLQKARKTQVSSF